MSDTREGASARAVAHELAAQILGFPPGQCCDDDEPDDVHSISCDRLTAAIEARDEGWNRNINENDRDWEQTLAALDAQHDKALEDVTARETRYRAALEVAKRGLRNIAGEHGNRNGVDWCGMCAHPDCVAHRCLEDIIRALGPPLPGDGTRDE